MSEFNTILNYMQNYNNMSTFGNMFNNWFLTPNYNTPALDTSLLNFNNSTFMSTVNLFDFSSPFVPQNNISNSNINNYFATNIDIFIKSNIVSTKSVKSSSTKAVTKTTKSKTKTPSTSTTHKKNLSNMKGLKQYNDLIEKYATKYGLEPSFVKAIISKESSFNPNAKSYAGAMGLMQLMPATAKQYGVKNAYDPEQNIDGGCKLLATLSKMYNGDKNKILCAYNWGSGNLAKNGYDKCPNETKEYIRIVLERQECYA